MLYTALTLTPVVPRGHHGLNGILFSMVSLLSALLFPALLKGL